MQELPFRISAIGTRSEDERDVLDMMQTEQRNRRSWRTPAIRWRSESLDGLGFLYNSNIDVAAATANDHRVGCRSAKARAGANVRTSSVTMTLPPRATVASASSNFAVATVSSVLKRS